MSPDLPNVPTPTLGGGPMWETIAEVGGYRVQRNRITQHCRLIDEGNVRRAWGDHEKCEMVLAQLLSGEGETKENLNIPMPTLGGMQFWADEMIRCGWRVQRNVFTGHCRLLDRKNVRQAWGTFEQCDSAMRRLHEASDLEPLSDRFVVLVHGIFGWKDRWSPMAEALNQAGYEIHDINYPSTRRGMEEHVEQLVKVVENLGENEEVNFVCHSMGGLLVRRLLEEDLDIDLGRVVMIATPNHGAVTADLVRDMFAYRLVFGPSGQQLVSGINTFTRDLPKPPCEFGVIAGAKGDETGFNPLLGEDNDGVVEVSSAKLGGMADFMTAPQLHQAIFRDKSVISSTVQFLQTGSFQGQTKTESH